MPEAMEEATTVTATMIKAIGRPTGADLAVDPEAALEIEDGKACRQGRTQPAPEERRRPLPDEEAALEPGDRRWTDLADLPRG